MARRRGPQEGQITFMPEECPECEGTTGSRIGLEQDPHTQVMYERWQCSCGVPVMVQISGRTV